MPEALYRYEKQLKGMRKSSVHYNAHIQFIMSIQKLYGAFQSFICSLSSQYHNSKHMLDYWL